MENRNFTIESERSRYLRSLKVFTILGIFAAIYYFSWMLDSKRPDHIVLYILLISAELFNFIQISGFWYTALNQKWPDQVKISKDIWFKPVDILIPVYNEPIEIVENTIKAVSNIIHPNKEIYILDDGPSDMIKKLASRYHVKYFSRPDRKGAKAGNINNALKQTDGHYVVFFDCDHAPYPGFLLKTLGFFKDEKIAFVQTPQFYKNKSENKIAAGAFEQQELFYGPICRGKYKLGAAFCCGTNVVFRRESLRQIGYLPEESITEDLLLSIKLHERGWKSVYYPEVLAEGLGPEDVGSYFSQQLRWARGGLEIFIKENTLLKNLTIPQKIQYFLSGIYWFTGWAYLIYAIMPILMLFFGIKPIKEADMYPLHFFPYLFINIVFLAYAANGTLTFRALWFSLCSFPVHIKAWLSIIFGRKLGFVVTPKGVDIKGITPHIYPQIFMTLLMIIAIFFGMLWFGANPSIMNNVAFAIVHIVLLSGFIRLSGASQISTVQEEVADKDKVIQMIIREDLRPLVEEKEEKEVSFHKLEKKVSTFIDESEYTSKIINDLIHKAYDQFEMGSYKEAISSFQMIIGLIKDPKLSLTFQLELCRFYYLIGDYSKTKKELDKAYSKAKKLNWDEFAQEIEKILLDFEKNQLA